MKIGLDLRFLNGDSYSKFIIELVKWLLYYDKENTYTIYTKRSYTVFHCENATESIVKIENGSFAEQTKFLKILKEDDNHLMIFFHYSKPLLYKKEYFTFVPSLKDIYYQDFNNHIEKYKYLFLLEQNLKNAKKVVCFDQNTKDELIERINLNEKNIFLLKAFFNNHKLEIWEEELALDINAKFSISDKYLIYSWGDWIEKNLERLLNVFHRLNKDNIDLDLVVLWEDVSKNIYLRNHIIEYELQNKVHFLWVVSPWERKLLYAKSLWTIFPSLYEPFPFELSESLFAEKPMLMSNLKNLENIFWKEVYYFSPISSNSIVESIKGFLNQASRKSPVLQNINKEYNIDNSTWDLLEKIINKA